ncbi:MAG: DNA repair protein RecO [Phycisphaerae bacterium]|nr:DNA repair protein RecO [Phycisphaerae bacterium]
MAQTSDQAVCLRVWDWSETSQTVSLFGRSAGVVRALAKGSKRPAAPFSGGIEPLQRADVGLIVKPSTDLATLTRWDLAEVFPALRRNLRALHAGLCAAELVIETCAQRDADAAIFDGLLELLRTLKEEPKTPAALVAFQWLVLVRTGYAPNLREPPDSVSGAVGGGKVPALFAPMRGGLVEAEQVESTEVVWRVRLETVSALRRLEAGEQLEGCESESIRRAGLLLGAYQSSIIGHELRTIGLVFGGAHPPEQADRSTRSEQSA